jgi:hypothetical protein
MSLSHIMSFGQGKVTNKQAGACPSVDLLCSHCHSQFRVMQTIEQLKTTGGLAENIPLRT